MLSFLKKRDMFGYSISLNLNSDSETYTTVIGGIYSIIFKSCMIGYIIFCINQIVTHSADSINTETYKEDLTTLPELSYRNTSMLMFHTLRKQNGVLPVYFQKPEVQRYVSVNFIQRREDWYKFKPGKNDHISRTDIGAK